MNIDEILKDLNKIPNARRDLLSNLNELTELVKCESSHDLFRHSKALTFDNREYFFSQLKENVLILTDSKFWHAERSAKEQLLKLKNELDKLNEVDKID